MNGLDLVFCGGSWGVVAAVLDEGKTSVCGGPESLRVDLQVLVLSVGLC